jgi:hypothetical protein
MIDQLLKPEVQEFIKDHQFDDPFALSLKSKSRNDFPLKEAIEQIHSLQKAKLKIPGWVAIENIIWPPPVSIEQSSSEITARFKSELIYGKSMVDLTGGMGVDTGFFAERFAETHYVESKPDLAAIAQHNFDVLKKNNISVNNDDAEDFLKKSTNHFDAIFLDPSRRIKNRKVFKIEDCAPNLYETVPKCLKLTNQLLIKLSPLVDLTLLIKDFAPVKIWVVSVKNEVKEVLCLIKNEKRKTLIFAVDLQFHVRNDKRAVKHVKTILFGFNQEEEATAQNTFSLPLKYIYEPSSAILKTGAFKLIGHRFGLKKLHVNTHLYTSDELVKDFPGRIFLLREQLKQNKKEVSRITPDNKINILTRNYPLSPVLLKNKLGLKDGGENCLIGTTLMDGKKALLFCERI